MKCPYCGAEVEGTTCEYCGSVVRDKHKATCPECGKQNIKFDREYQGVNKIPIGVCRDCGYTWDLRSNMMNNFTPEVQTKFILLIFGFLICFPVPITYLVWTAKSLSVKAKYIIIGILWAAYLGVFIFPFISMFFFW